MTKEEAIDIIKDAGYGYLATVDGNQPKVRPMMPYLSDEGLLFLALLPSSRTIPQIKKNPHVEFCFVDRKMWLCRVEGIAKVGHDFEKKEMVWNNVPMLRQYFSGPEDSNLILLEIEITRVEAMTPTQQTPDSISLK